MLYELFIRKVKLNFLTFSLAFYCAILPAFADNYQELVVSLKVNYEDTDIICTVLTDEVGEEILVPLENIKQFGVKDDYLEIATIAKNGIPYINLKNLTNTKYNLDTATLTLEINFPTQSMKKQIMEGIVEDKNFPHSESATGMFLNYDITTTNIQNKKYLAGVQELNIFSDKGICTNSFLVKKSFGTKERTNKLARLETNYTFDNVDKMARIRVGDSITKASSWSGGTRFGGIQYSTNFAVRPDFITFPLAAFTGKAELPTTLDVYANSTQLYRAKVKPGDFEIMNLPVTSGRGDIVVRTEDITGKVRTITIPYYIVPMLLKPGLSDYSIDFGAQRKNYGVDSNKYKSLVTNIDYMHGLNEYWTSGAHFEAVRKNGTFGVTNNLKIGTSGIITNSLATNIHKTNKAQRIMIGYSYQGTPISFNVSVSKNSENYIDIYNFPLRTSTKPLFQASAGYNNLKLGSIFLNFLSYQTAPTTEGPGNKVRVISLSYQKDITKKIFSRFSIGKNMSKKDKSSFGSISFGINLDKQYVNINSSRSSSSRTNQVAISSINNRYLGVGYNAAFTKGAANTTAYDMTFDRRGQYFDTALFLFGEGKHNIQQLNLMGSVIAMDKSVFLGQQVQGSLALVRTRGIKNIPVYNNNLIVGVTNNKGKAIIPNVIPYSTSEIRLDEEKLPLNVDFASVKMKTRPKYKTGIILDFDINEVRSIEMSLVGDKGEHFKVNKLIRVLNVEEEIFTGYDSKIYINDVKDMKMLEGGGCFEADRCCKFSVPLPTGINETVIDLGEVICK